MHNRTDLLIEADRVTEIHTPPWDPNGRTEIVEVKGTVAAFQYDFNDFNEPQSSFAWQYVGNGRWSEAAQIPISSHHARVGDTVLMFDHTNATCCGDPIPGLSQWPLLSSNDGINWIELDTRTAQDVHALQIRAGGSFWVYGPDIGGGGNDIETESATTLWISRDGRSWEPVDTSFAPPSFVVAVGDLIILADRSSAYDGIGTYWIGTVREQ